MSKSVFDVFVNGKDIQAEETDVEVFTPPPAKLDIEAARRAIMDAFSEQVETTCALANNFQVTNADQLTQGIDLGKLLSKLAKALKDNTLEITKEAREFTSSMNGLKDHFLLKINPALNVLKPRLKNYQDKMRIAQAEVDRRIREEQEKIQRQLEEEARGKGVEINLPVIPPASDKAKPTVTRTSSGASLGVRKKWKCTGVKDIKLVPAEYLLIDNPKVNSAIDAGIHEIPGLIIEEVEIPVLR